MKKEVLSRIKLIFLQFQIPNSELENKANQIFLILDLNSKRDFETLKKKTISS